MEYPFGFRKKIDVFYQGLKNTSQNAKIIYISERQNSQKRFYQEG